jgi:DNA polymerase
MVLFHYFPRPPAIIRDRGLAKQAASIAFTRYPLTKGGRVAQAATPRSLAALNRLILKAAPMVPGGTRAVLGEGPLRPGLAMVGEQPGDREDLEGRPFVGPAGKLLDRAMAEAGIDRSRVYVTNAVKHFKFEQRGKRRLHARPNAGEVKHYRWWLQKELDLVKPRVVVALGATAVLALTGKALPIGANRGKAEFDGRCGFITVHPSSLLRLRDESDRRNAFHRFVADLESASGLAQTRACAVPGNLARVAERTGRKLPKGKYP